MTYTQSEMPATVHTHCIRPRGTRHGILEVCHCCAVIDQAVDICLIAVCFCDIRIQISAQASGDVIESVCWLGAFECLCERESSEWDGVVYKGSVVDATAARAMRQDDSRA